MIKEYKEYKEYEEFKDPTTLTAVNVAALL